jgi:hypothetical protein
MARQRKQPKTPTTPLLNTKVMRMRPLNLVSGGVLWCVNLDETSSTSKQSTEFNKIFPKRVFRQKKKTEGLECERKPTTTLVRS